VNRLKALREEKGISQAELAKLTGLSRTTISKIENGEAVNVNTKTIVKIAEVFAVQPSEIFLL
jgi:putative transcriptional regulator